MPPLLALILCTIFVLWLLYMERKQSPDSSWVLWIPTIWMLSIASKPLGVWFATSADIEGGSPLDRIFQSTVIIIGFIIIAWRKTGCKGVLKDNWPLFLLMGYMLMSVLWTNDQYMSFKRWARAIPVVIMAFVVLTERSPRQALESLFRRTIYILIPFSVLLIKYYTKLGVAYTRWEGEQMWLGVTLHKNGLGRLCLVSAFFLIWTLIRRWKERDVAFHKYLNYVDIFLLCITLWLLKGPPGSYSATSITSLAAGLTILFFIWWLKKRQIVLSANTLSAIMVFIFVFGIITFFVGGSTIGGVSGTVGRDASLTGRTDVWVALIPVAMQKPLLGLGFGGFWTPETMELYNISGSHNGYLDILLELGFVGIIFFALFLIHSIRKAQKYYTGDFDWSNLWICFLIMLVIHNITESSLVGLSTHLTTIIIFLTICSMAKTSPDRETSS